jgi:hypothetical protein
LFSPFSLHLHLWHAAIITGLLFCAGGGDDDDDDDDDDDS